MVVTFVFMKTTDVTLAQANALTQARYNFTVIEKRRQFIETKTGQKDLFDDLVVRINTEDLQKTDSSLRDIYASLRSLRKKSIYIEDKDRVLDVGYINYFEHKKLDSHLEVQVSCKILPFLVELAGQFTSYSLTVAIALKTKYAQRFFCDHTGAVAGKTDVGECLSSMGFASKKNHRCSTERIARSL